MAAHTPFYYAVNPARVEGSEISRDLNPQEIARVETVGILRNNTCVGYEVIDRMRHVNQCNRHVCIYMMKKLLPVSVSLVTLLLSSRYNVGAMYWQLAEHAVLKALSYGGFDTEVGSFSLTIGLMFGAAVDHFGLLGWQVQPLDSWRFALLVTALMMDRPVTDSNR